MENFYYSHNRPMNFNGFYEPNIRHGWNNNERLLKNSFISNPESEYNLFDSYLLNSQRGNWDRIWNERNIPAQNWLPFQNWSTMQNWTPAQNWASWSPVQNWYGISGWNGHHTPSNNFSLNRGWDDKFIPSYGWMNARGWDERYIPSHGFNSPRGLEDRNTPFYNMSSMRDLDNQFYPSYHSNILRGFDDRYVPTYGSPVMRDLKDRHFEGLTGQHDQTCMFGNVPHNHNLCTEQKVYEPATYLVEEHDSTVIQIELFGVNEKDFRVMTMGNNLIIEGFKEISTLSNQKSKNAQQAKLYFMGPVWHGAFKRVISLNYLIEASSINASFSNGVLTLTVKKPQSHKSEFVKVISK